ncbi:hypothetical protein Ac2012v2_007626 [Leucoagaricus gongylophorus]
MPAPPEFIEYVDTNADSFIQRLKTAVEIPSVSGDVSRRLDVIRMAQFLKQELESVGVTTQLTDIGTQEIEGQTLPLPPVILGKIGNDRNKKTILVYGHFDVQPAFMSDGWETEPFKLVIDEATGRLIGRGASDDKGPVLGWVNVLQWHHDNKKDLPVNLVCCFEGMEESGSEGLDELVKKESQPGGWFNGVDAVCISDNYWLNTTTPALTYGLRGISYYKITVSGPGRDLHSGVFGRMVFEPMTDLITIMSKLVDNRGNILIPGVQDQVILAYEDEKKIYADLHYSIQDVQEAAGGDIALSSDKVKVLMGRMREPSLSLHGIEGAFSGVGAKTVIPAKVSGKFSIRLVPPQTPETVDPHVVEYIQELFKSLDTKNKLEIECLHGGKPWVTDPEHWNFEAAKRATWSVYKQIPDLTREGGSIPVTLTFAENLGVNVLLLPMGRGDDGAHSTNEKLDKSNYIQGTKLLGAYLYEVATA